MRDAADRRSACSHAMRNSLRSARDRLLPALPAARGVAREGRRREESGVLGGRLLGPSCPRLRRPEAKVVTSVSHLRPWREQDGQGLHRRPLGRLPLRRAAPRGLRGGAGLTHHRRRRAPLGTLDLRRLRCAPRRTNQRLLSATTASRTPCASSSCSRPRWSSAWAPSPGTPPSASMAYGPAQVRPWRRGDGGRRDPPRLLPSFQQNTFTGVLKPEMLDAVLMRARELDRVSVARRPGISGI